MTMADSRGPPITNPSPTLEVVERRERLTENEDTAKDGLTGAFPNACGCPAANTQTGATRT